jgi:uncharacterized protein (DUF697 family)
MADEEYDQVLRTATATVAAAATAPLAMSPVPLSDTAAMAGIWATMLVAIAKKSGHSLDADTARRMALAATAGAGGYLSGCKVFAWTLAKIPGPGMVVGSTASGTLNVAFTLFMGYVFIDLFEKPNFDPLDIEYSMAYFQRCLKPYLSSAMLHRIGGFMQRARHDVRKRTVLAWGWA